MNTKRKGKLKASGLLLQVLAAPGRVTHHNHQVTEVLLQLSTETPFISNLFEVQTPTFFLYK